LAGSARGQTFVLRLGDASVRGSAGVNLRGVKPSFFVFTQRISKT
jgi:hypothetical protein